MNVVLMKASMLAISISSIKVNVYSNISINALLSDSRVWSDNCIRLSESDLGLHQYNQDIMQCKVHPNNSSEIFVLALHGKWLVSMTCARRG